MWLRLQTRQAGADCFEHLARLFEEDAEQFSIDDLVARLRQLQNIRRRLRRICSLGHERRHGLFDLRRHGGIFVQRRKHGLGLLTQRRIGHKVGVTSQGGQILLDLLTQTGVLRLIHQRTEQGMGFPFLLLDLLFDALLPILFVVRKFVHFVGNRHRR